MKNKLRIWMLVLTIEALVLAFCMACGVAAQEGGELPQPNVQTPEAFLRWLVLAAPTLIGMLFSLLERKWVAFQGLTSTAKWWLNFGLSTVIPVAAGLLLMYVDVEFWRAIQPVFTLVMTAILASLGYVGNQVVYLLLVRPNESEAQGGV